MSLSKRLLFPIVTLSAAFALAGCTQQPAPPTQTAATQPAATEPTTAEAKSEVDEVKEAMSKLSEEDRTLAVAQGYCATSSEPLGSMGVPIKLSVNDQPVFICCKGCERGAMKDPEKTLAKVEELKAKVKSETK